LVIMVAVLIHQRSVGGCGLGRAIATLGNGKAKGRNRGKLGGRDGLATVAKLASKKKMTPTEEASRS
jgi:hypothetical protein